MLSWQHFLNKTVLRTEFSRIPSPFGLSDEKTPVTGKGNGGNLGLCKEIIYCERKNKAFGRVSVIRKFGGDMFALNFFGGNTEFWDL